MDASRRRCFLEVYTERCSEPRLLQLEPTVKFHNVVKRFDGKGDLYWGDHRIDPETTPAAVGMRCGVDEANTLWYIPAPPRARSYNHSHVDSAIAVHSQASVDGTEILAPHPGCGTSLPAYFEDRTALPSSSGHHAMHGRSMKTLGASISPDRARLWYSRPRLLSPVPPLVGGASPSRAQPSTTPMHPVADTTLYSDAAVNAAEFHGNRQQNAVVQHLYGALAPHAPAPSYTAMSSRRNAPVCIDPHILVDDLDDALDVSQAVTRRCRDEAHAIPPRGPLNPGPVAPARPPPSVDTAPGLSSPIRVSTPAPSIEELAAYLHDGQMRRLYEQRRLYIAHGLCPGAGRP
ncbi:hypothetical protein JKF63_02500 [Porcisia hertigi]|uniref:Uncharacterized protein n=1 Tax=Porcisia hertigi TaxID=2761500 RepID=A0A836HNS9_9TRYP|nr:hypothetical protein JKF63_02500 [Porcisia hertigi]